MLSAQSDYHDLPQQYHTLHERINKAPRVAPLLFTYQPADAAQYFRRTGRRGQARSAISREQPSVLAAATLARASVPRHEHEGSLHQFPAY